MVVVSMRSLLDIRLSNAGSAVLSGGASGVVADGIFQSRRVSRMDDMLDVRLSCRFVVFRCLPRCRISGSVRIRADSPPRRLGKFLLLKRQIVRTPRKSVCGELNVPRIGRKTEYLEQIGKGRAAYSIRTLADSRSIQDTPWVSHSLLGNALLGTPCQMRGQFTRKFRCIDDRGGFVGYAHLLNSACRMASLGLTQRVQRRGVMKCTGWDCSGGVFQGDLRSSVAGHEAGSGGPDPKPAAQIGTSRVSFAANGTGEPECRPNPCLGRPCSGERPVDPASGRLCTTPSVQHPAATPAGSPKERVRRGLHVVLTAGRRHACHLATSGEAHDSSDATTPKSDQIWCDANALGSDLSFDAIGQPESVDRGSPRNGAKSGARTFRSLASETGAQATPTSRRGASGGICLTHTHTPLPRSALSAVLGRCATVALAPPPPARCTAKASLGAMLGGLRRRSPLGAAGRHTVGVGLEAQSPELRCGEG